MSGRVRPEPWEPLPPLPRGSKRQEQQREELQDVLIDEEPSIWIWIKRRWWAIALLTLLAAGLLVTVITIPVCLTVGCPRRTKEVQAESGLMRLVIQFNAPDVLVSDVIPGALLAYITSVTKLDSSWLQVLEFDDEDILQRTRQELLKDPRLQLLIRDFAMRYYPTGAPPLSAAAAAASGASALDLDTLLRSAAPGTDPSQVINAIAGAVANVNPGRRALKHTQPGQLSAPRRALLQQPIIAGSSGPASGSSGSSSSNSTAGAAGDPIFGALNTLYNDPFLTNGTQWHHARIRSQAAWTLTKGAQPVIVAVIDSGFDLTHPDLVQRFWTNPKEIPGNGLDDDGNGFADDIHGWAFVGACAPGSKGTASTNCQRCVGSNDVSPSNAHGTHVAGLVAATVNNFQGGAGTAPNIQLMLLKVSDCTAAGAISASTVFQALDYAYRMGAHIVTMSIGSNFNLNINGGGQPRAPAPDTTYLQNLQAYTAAVQPLSTKQVLVLAAAGNENLNLTELYRLQYTYTPCMVPTGNMLCVGATDLYDNRAYFSNHGSAVALSAPGVSILSTYWSAPAPDTDTGGAYQVYDGTSQATPITAGVAALVASVLGSTDKNYYRASQIRDILVSSGDNSAGLAGFTNSSRRINAYNAVTLAQNIVAPQSGTPVLGPFIPATSTFTRTVTVNGFTERYWPNANAQFMTTAGLTMLDESIRNGGPEFLNFKYTTGVMVDMSAYIRVNSTGIHTFTVTYPIDFLSARVVVNGVPLGMVAPAGSQSSQSGSFLANATGWYQITFQMLPVSQGAVRVTLTTPGSSGPQLYSDSYVTWTDQVFVSPPLTNNYTDTTTNGSSLPSWGYNTGWMVFYNRTDEQGLSWNASTVNALSTLVKPDSYWQTQLIVRDLNLATGNFRSTIQLPGDTANSLMGYATTILDARSLPSSTVRFAAICKACSVYVNDLLVLDNWVGYAAPFPFPKQSSCVTLDPASVNMMRLTVRFVAGGSSALFVSVQSCGGSDPPQPINNQQRVSLSPAVIDYSNMQAQQYLGWIGGVQCDIWRSANATGVPNDGQPLYKFRLPACPSPELTTSTCSAPWSFSLSSAIAPDVAVFSPPGTRFGVRCWAYTNASLPTALTAAPTSTYTRVYLAGLQRFLNTPGSAPVQIPVPGEIRYSSTLHQLLVEWADVNATQVLSVLGNGVPLTITLQSFMLPLYTVADPNGSQNPQDIVGWGGGYPVGQPGAYIQVSTLAGSVTTSSNGLSTTYQMTNTSALAGKVRYAVAEGFYWTLEILPSLNTFKFDQAPGTAVQVLAGGVVIRNAPAFSPFLPAQAAQQVQMYLPSGYLHMKIITKIQNPTAAVTYNWMVSTPTTPDTLMNQNYWVRGSWQPQTN